MRPRTKLVLSIAALVAGLVLLLALFLNSNSTNAGEVFLAVLLFAGGAIALWTRAKTEKAATGPSPVVQVSGAFDSPKTNGGDDFLAEFLKKTEDGPNKTETEAAPTKTEADEFLAQFLKK